MRKNLLVALTLLLGLGALVSAQMPPKPDLGKVRASLEADKADARALIRTLLKGAKASFVIDGDVQGTVTASFEDVTVERALMEVLRQVGAGYRYEDGIYRIIKLQDKPISRSPDSQLVTLDLNGADVREALRPLFKTFGISYTIAPEVQGKVTLSLKNVSFEATLVNILKQVEATYGIEGGVYHVVKREAPGGPDLAAETFDLDLQNAEVREALRSLFKRVNISYSIAPEVQGNVTATLKGVTFETALQNILKQVDSTYRVDGGVYQIIKR